MEKILNHNILNYIEKFDKINNRKKIYTYLSLVAILLLTYNHFFLSPAYSKIQNLRKNITAAKLRLNADIIKANGISRVKKEKDIAASRLNKALPAIANKNETPNPLASISEAGRDLGLEFLLFEPENQIKQNILIRLPVSFRIKGSYFGLINFLNKIALLPRLINIDAITIETIENNMLLIDFKASTYGFTNED